MIDIKLKDMPVQGYARLYAQISRLGCGPLVPHLYRPRRLSLTRIALRHHEVGAVASGIGALDTGVDNVSDPSNPHQNLL
jgi:hypothetical protein